MIKFSREWCMPSADTFSMIPVKKLLDKYIHSGQTIVDPFARNSTIATISNDLNPTTSARYHMDAISFVDMLISQNIQCDVVLFDPPYSPRQVSEVYQSIGIKTTSEHTQTARLYKQVKFRLARVLKPGGISISFGWNSIGFGKKLGFKIIEIKLISHGGAHNDTIVTVEEKLKDIFGNR